MRKGSERRVGGARSPDALAPVWRSRNAKKRSPYGIKVRDQKNAGELVF